MQHSENSSVASPSLIDQLGGDDIPSNRVRSQTNESEVLGKQAPTEEEKKKKKRGRKSSQKRTVKAGDLEILFLQLGEERFQARDFLYTFLTTYRYFTRSTEVIKALQSVYRQQKRDQVQEEKEEEVEEARHQSTNVPPKQDIFSFAEPATPASPSPSTSPSSGRANSRLEAPTDVSPERGSSPLQYGTSAGTNYRETEHLSGLESLQFSSSLRDPLGDCTQGDIHAPRKKPDSDLFRPRLYQSTDLRPRRARPQKPFCSMKDLGTYSSAFDMSEHAEDLETDERSTPSCPPSLGSNSSELNEKAVFLDRTDQQQQQTPNSVEPSESQSAFSASVSATSSSASASIASQDMASDDSATVNRQHQVTSSSTETDSSPGSMSKEEWYTKGRRATSYTVIPPTSVRDEYGGHSKTTRWLSLPALLRKKDGSSDVKSPSGSTRLMRPLRPSMSDGDEDNFLATYNRKSRKSMPCLPQDEDIAEGKRPMSVLESVQRLRHGIVGDLHPRRRSSVAGTAVADELAENPKDTGRPATSYSHSPMSSKRKTSTTSLSKLKDQKCSPLTLRVFNILKQWIKTFPDDFCDNSQSYQLILDFIEEVKLSSILADIALAKNLEKCLQANTRASAADAALNQIALPSLGEFGPKFSTFSHECLAEQMTLSTHQTFRRIRPGELCKQAWKRPNRREIAPNVCNIIDRCNRLGNWVPSVILTGKTPAKRAEIIEKVIRIAFHCMELHNLNDTLIIAYSLQNSAVERLAKSWKLVPSKVLKMLSDVKQVCSADERYQAMRTYIHACEPPCVPFVGAYLDMIYGIDVTMSTFDDKGFVNFAKMVRLAKQIRELIQFQQEQYKDLESDAVTQHYLNTCPILEDDDVIFAQSLECEPRENKSPDGVLNNELVSS